MLAVHFLKHDNVTMTLLGIALIILGARLAGKLFERLGQPPVVGEVVAGLLLGPTILGSRSEALFPIEARPMLKIVSTIGLVVFMFVIGLELDTDHLGRDRRRVAGAVALTGTVIPFALGMLAALALYGRYQNGTDLLPFALFLGAAMSITAFPVLARILVERDLFAKPLGVLTMACAAGDDVLTWATLALVVAIVSSAGAWDLPYICVTAIAFGVVMVTVVRPVLRRYADRRLDATVMSTTMVGILLCSFVTAAIGVHEIFGAFLLGAIFPRGPLAREVRDRFSSIAVVLLPVFFVTVGLNVDIGAVGIGGIAPFALILLVACAGKLIGAIVGAAHHGAPAARVARPRRADEHARPHRARGAEHRTRPRRDRRSAVHAARADGARDDRRDGAAAARREAGPMARHAPADRAGRRRSS